MSALAARSLVYGPVPSRRLGISLGVDLIPHKMCTFDCLYCQVGGTTHLGLSRQDFGASPDEVMAQVLRALERSPDIQVITLAGSGEPTLYQPLEPLIQGLRRATDLPLVLLTNGALLWQPEVRKAVNLLDRVYPSLDAADAETFRQINRPAPGLTLDQLLSGLRRFCDDFTGHCRLELMLVRGINDSPASISAMADLARGLRIEGVDLNTVVRPPAHAAHALSQQEMQLALTHFQGLDAQVIASFSRASAARDGLTGTTRKQILQTVARRPCTEADLSASLGLDPDALKDLLKEMVARGELEQAGAFYKRP